MTFVSRTVLLRPIVSFRRRCDEEIHVGVAVLIVAVALTGFSNPAWRKKSPPELPAAVVDPSGAAVKGATATATDTERGTVWTAPTNDAGVFSLTRLPVGTYTVRVTAPGFQAEIYPAFTLVLNQTASLNFQMKMGKASETVEVTWGSAGASNSVHRGQHSH